MKQDATYWLHKLGTLRIDKARGNPAPHKPLLLLVVLEMAEKGEIKEETLVLSPDLAYRFSVYWAAVADRRNQRPDIRLPFHHLKEIWNPLMSDGKPSPDKKLTVKVQINSSFFRYLLDAEFRNTARQILISTTEYFLPSERITLCAMMNIKPEKIDKVSEGEAKYTLRLERGRDARFRIEVVIVAYKHTCALTGYRMMTLGDTNMESIVDAAHIHKFSESRNNDPCNGLALCKNAHWQFDRGLWSITDDYRVIVNRDKFIEEGVPGQKLADFDGHRLILPSDPKYWPDPTHLAWHRKQKLVER